MDALKNSRELDIRLFNAQQARRLLDRIVGYKISPYLWQKFSKNWLSAGRVQTVALRLLVERQKERELIFQSVPTLFLKVFSKEEHVIEAKLLNLCGEPLYISNKITLFDGIYQFQETKIIDAIIAERERNA